MTKKQLYRKNKTSVILLCIIMFNGKLWHLEVSPRGQSTETEACEKIMLVVMVILVVLIMMKLMTEISKAFFIKKKGSGSDRQ